MKVAVCMIVKDEQELLPRCLESVKGFDALYITDTGSEDETVNIAKKYTKNVSFFQWCDSFAKARNYALSQVSNKYDWVLSIDADEYLESTYEQVKEVVENTKGLAVNVRVRSEKDGSVHMFPRLFKHCKEVFWVNDIHNLLNVSTRENSEITTVYGYSPAHKKDPDRALRILKKSLAENPGLIREKYYLGREYYYRGDWKRAISMLNKYVKESKFLAERNDAWLMRARCLAKLNKYNEACDSAWQALKYNANFEEALRFIGDHMDPGNKVAWHRYADLADNSNVLFVRNSKNANKQAVPPSVAE